MRPLPLFASLLLGAAACTVAMALPLSVNAEKPMILVRPSDDASDDTAQEIVIPSETDLHLHGPEPTTVPVSLYAENLRERLVVDIPTEAAFVSDGVLDQLADLLRCKHTGRRHRIDPGVAVALARVAEEFPGREIVVVSGFRARNTPRTSRHSKGRAVDFRVTGVPARKVRDFVWKNLDQVGVGHYHAQGFIHVDIRRREPKIGWDQRRPGSHYIYHPYWATGSGTRTARVGI